MSSTLKTHLHPRNGRLYLNPAMIRQTEPAPDSIEGEEECTWTSLRKFQDILISINQNSD